MTAPTTALALFEHDRSLGFRFVAGADEAGRGAFAGPLVAAAVVFDYERVGDEVLTELTALNDSKRLSLSRREELYPLVLRHASVAVTVSRCAAGIDCRGLHVTNLSALHEALDHVARPGCTCLSDGYAVAELGYPQQAIKKGDSTSAAIAAASVIAKVTRDRYMQRADKLYPGWGFAEHVGYGTAEHREAIERLGVSPLHRMSFNSAAYTQLKLAA